MKFALVGLLGGLFVTVCALALLDSARRPIKSQRDLTDIADLPVLASGVGSSSGDRLWANVQFATEGDILSICLVPVSGNEVYGSVSQQLAKSAILKHCQSKAVTSEQIDDVETLMNAVPVLVVLCGPLKDEIKGAYIANKATSTVVLVSRWRDDAASVAATLRELRLAKANVVGLFLL